MKSEVHLLAPTFPLFKFCSLFCGVATGGTQCPLYTPTPIPKTAKDPTFTHQCKIKSLFACHVLSGNSSLRHKKILSYLEGFPVLTWEWRHATSLLGGKRYLWSESTRWALTSQCLGMSHISGKHLICISEMPFPTHKKERLNAEGA